MTTPAASLALARAGWQRLQSSSLVMNALYLMLSTAVLAGGGFVFWVIVTRSYDAAAVGLATTLLSVSGLLSLLGLAGFDTTFVRFLPHAARKNAYISSGLIVVALVSGVLALGLGLALPRVMPGMAVLAGVGALTSFVFFTVITALNTLTNAVFLAYKQAKYILMINVWFCGLKVLLPLLLVRGGAMVIFGLAGLAQLLGLLLSIGWMRRTFGYRFTLGIDLAALRSSRSFSVSTYLSSILNLLPPTLLPLLTVFHLGAANAAFYYMAFTIAGVLYMIIYAAMQSVFAEGSHNETAVRGYVVKAAKLVAVLLIPAGGLMLALSDSLLTIFGTDYAAHAAGLLRLFVLGAVPVAAYSALGAICKVTKNLAGMVWMNVAYAAVITGLSYLWLNSHSLAGIGWAWILGNLAACCIGMAFVIHNKGGGNHGTAS